MRVAVAGSLATKMVLGEDTNFNIADIKRARRMAERFVFYYGAWRLYDTADLPSLGSGHMPRGCVGVV
jgi:hypothetical protein